MRAGRSSSPRPSCATTARCRRVDLAIPLFGYQNHVSIDRGFGFIRRWTATDAAAYEGRRLREGLQLVGSSLESLHRFCAPNYGFTVKAVRGSRDAVTQQKFGRFRRI
jgi:hypothetical protein